MRQRFFTNASPDIGLVEGVPLPSKEVARDRVLDDDELARVILVAREIGGPYGGIVELLALTGQRREEAAGLQREELDLAQQVWALPKSRTKNAKAHVVHLSDQSMAVLKRAGQAGPYVFSLLGTKPFQEFSRAKRRLDQLSGVTGSRGGRQAVAVRPAVARLRGADQSLHGAFRDQRSDASRGIFRLPPQNEAQRPLRVPVRKQEATSRLSSRRASRMPNFPFGRQWAASMTALDPDQWEQARAEVTPLVLITRRNL
jgi:hypothetical protein